MLWTLGVLVCALSLTAFCLQYVQRSIQEDARTEFSANVDRIEASIHAQFLQPLYGIRGAIGAQASTNVNNKLKRANFRAYVSTRDLHSEFPGIRGFGYVERVMRQDLRRFEAVERADESPHFSVKTTGNAPELYVVKYIEPLADNVAAVGLDAGAEPIRREAVERAINSGEPSLSGAVKLAQDGSKSAGFLFFVPVYANGQTPNTTEARREQLVGLFYTPLVANELLFASSFVTNGAADFELFDGTDPQRQTLVFSSRKMLDTSVDQGPPKNFAENSEFHLTRTLWVGGRLLQMHTGSSAAFEEQLDHRTPLLVGLGGVALSLLLATLTWLVLRGHVRAVSRASTMTNKLDNMVVTQQRVNTQLTNAMRESQTLMAAIDQHSLVSMTDAAGTITYANDTFSAISGYSQPELLGQNHRLVNSQVQSDEFWADMWKTISSGYVWRGMVCNRAKNGSLYWVDTLISPFFGEHGIEKYISIRTDVTATKMAQEALTRTTLMLQSVLDSASQVMLITTGLDHNITLFNTGAERMLGYKAAEVVGVKTGMSFIDTEQPDDRLEARSSESGRQVLPANMVIDESTLGKKMELTLRRKDGSQLQVAMVITPLANAAGVRTGYLGIGHDISTEKKYEHWLRTAMEEAQAATIAKGQFLANMSHEIRTPMNAILGMLTLLQETELSARQMDYAAKSERAAKSLLALLNDMLDFSKIDAGKMELDPQPFEVDRLMRDLSVILSATLNRKPIEILFDIDPTLPKFLTGDAMRLQQVLINLGGNAIKFTTQGEVIIQLKVLPQVGPDIRVRFCVQDTGIGIAPENLSHIFDGFSQAEASTTRRFGGTGLGLSISKRLVGLMGSELAVESELGQGSSFHFTVSLPIASTTREVATLAAAPAPASLQVLAVDDNPTALAIMVNMARSFGWSVDQAASGAEALALVNARIKTGQAPYQVIIVDWLMPQMDGWETLRQVTQVLPQGKAPIIVMVTTNGRETLSQRTQQELASLHSFLVKPITAPMLLDAVTNAMAGRSNLRTKPRTRDAKSRPLEGLRLLVVEDNVINQHVALELLQSAGAQVEIADNGQLGVNAIATAKKPFDAVLMDIQMPVMDGYTATQVIRQELGMADLPVIAMTANAMATDRDACLAAGMNEHVGKPFDLPHLVTVICKQIKPTNKALPPSSEPRLLEQRALAQPDVVDVAGAIARLGNNSELYARILQSYLTQLADSPEELHDMVQRGAFAEAAALMHTLKGLSATVGASYLASVAATAERTLQGEGAASRAPHLYASFKEAVVKTGLVMNEVALNLPQQERPAENPSATLDMPGVLKMLKELQNLLKNSDLRALDIQTQLHAMLDSRLSEEFKALETAIAAFDFARSQIECDVLIQKMTLSI